MRGFKTLVAHFVCIMIIAFFCLNVMIILTVLCYLVMWYVAINVVLCCGNIVDNFITEILFLNVYFLLALECSVFRIEPLLANRLWVETLQ